MSKLVDTSNIKELNGNILELLEGVGEEGLSTRVIELALDTSHLKAIKDNLNRALNYLKAKGYIDIKRIENKTLNVSREIITITGSGIDIVLGLKVDEGVDING